LEDLPVLRIVSAKDVRRRSKATRRVLKTKESHTKSVAMEGVLLRSANPLNDNVFDMGQFAEKSEITLCGVNAWASVLLSIRQQ
jgi:hypothetical protein